MGSIGNAQALELRLDLGPEAVTPAGAATGAFLDHVLRGREDPGLVRFFDVGTRGWAGFSA